MARPARKAPARPIALTMGEPAGIGGEICLMAWARRGVDSVPPFFAIDDPARLEVLAAKIGLTVPIRAIDEPAEALDAFEDALPVLPLALSRPVLAGRPDPANATAVLASIDQAVAFCRDGAASAVVTNPIQKAALYGAGFRHPGHTEYLAELVGGVMPVMMLVGAGLRVVPVTVHMALKAALARLDRKLIVETAVITANALQRDFGVAKPRLVLAGVNPHAGEHGNLGREDLDIVAPAVAELVRLGIDARGPASADTLFHARARARYDAAICMYHDQALIPLKTVDFDGGVNVTLGLPIVRTSPDHGTALDIAGTGAARPDSLIAALKLAETMAASRARHSLIAGPVATRPRRGARPQHG